MVHTEMVQSSMHGSNRGAKYKLRAVLGHLGIRMHCKNAIYSCVKYEPGCLKYLTQPGSYFTNL